jgi:flagellar motor switch/type III secretory pathway protein FliN
MTLPFDLPVVSRGFAALTPTARAAGRRAAAAAADAIGALVGARVAVSGRAVPAVPVPVAGWARLRVELTALPGVASIEVESRLGVALLDLLCGGPGTPEPASAVTPMERAALELAVLSALDGLASLDEVETRLAPRLTREAGGPVSGLAVELAVQVGACAGRVRLILPPAAVGWEDDGGGDRLRERAFSLSLSLRRGSASLTPGERAALEPGDVVLLDAEPGRLAAVAPGGLRFAGKEVEDHLQIEEIQMAESSSEWPLALEVELARVPITLGALARLEPGAVIPLPIDRRGTVALKVGDRTFARGQLVDVEGGVGVRIDSLVEGP